MRFWLLFLGVLAVLAVIFWFICDINNAPDTEEEDGYAHPLLPPGPKGSDPRS